MMHKCSTEELLAGAALMHRGDTGHLDYLLLIPLSLTGKGYFCCESQLLYTEV